jgi:hypothetical protein
LRLALTYTSKQCTCSSLRPSKQKSWSKEALQLPRNPTHTLWLQDQAEAAAHGAGLQGTSCPAFSMQPLEVEVPTAPTVLSDQAARAAQSNGGLTCMCSGQELDMKQAWARLQLLQATGPRDNGILGHPGKRVGCSLVR